MEIPKGVDRYFGVLRPDTIRDNVRAMYADMDAIRARWMTAVKDVIIQHGKAKVANPFFDESKRVYVDTDLLGDWFEFDELNGKTAEITVMTWQYLTLLGWINQNEYIAKENVPLLYAAFAQEAYGRWMETITSLFTGKMPTLGLHASVLTHYLLDEADETETVERIEPMIGALITEILDKFVKMKTSFAFGDLTMGNQLAAQIDEKRRW
jgi:hypothetical protein